MSDSRESFAQRLRPLVEPIGAPRAGELCGVTERTIRLWLRGEGNPNRATQTGVLEILRKAADQSAP